MLRSPMRKIKISVGAVTLGLALVAGPAAGVAQARTAPYPDLDLVTLKTTGGFVGGVSYGTSYIKWNSTKGYTRYLWLEDGVREGRCMAVYERATFTTGKIEPYTKLGTACDSQGTAIYSDRTSPTAFRSLTVKLCRLTTALQPDNCVTTTVKPGVD